MCYKTRSYKVDRKSEPWANQNEPNHGLKLSIEELSTFRRNQKIISLYCRPNMSGEYAKFQLNLIKEMRLNRLTIFYPNGAS